MKLLLSFSLENRVLFSNQKSISQCKRLNYSRIFRRDSFRRESDQHFNNTISQSFPIISQINPISHFDLRAEETQGDITDMKVWLTAKSLASVDTTNATVEYSFTKSSFEENKFKKITIKLFTDDWVRLFKLKMSSAH